ncbi:MAG: hypothetical protein ACYC6Y_22135 [Thermoguttaceae bacterium]
MTKSIVVLTLGCLPLAVLTVASFAGIGHRDSDFPSTGRRGAASPSASAETPSADALRGDTALSGGVAEREFLAGEPLPDDADQADPLYLASLPANWQHWSDATQLVRDCLGVEEALLGAARPQMEAAIDRITILQDVCRKKDPAGAARLASVLERRKGDLQAAIALQKKRELAQQLQSDAEHALAGKDYDTAIRNCTRLLEEFAPVVDFPAVADLKRRAMFWQQWSTLPLESSLGEKPEQQRNVLEGFLDSYQDLPGQLEQERVARVSRRLEVVQTELRRIEMNQAARAPIASLAIRDGQAFADGLAQAARIAQTYPTDSVRGQLQQRVLAWLGQSLPAKQPDEPAGLEEVETVSGEVLRGFFTPVSDGGGGVIGYKRYATAEERDSPTRNVGRYPAADLRGVPTRSVPRQCADAYETARRRLLAEPDNPNSWSALRRACESSEAALVDYRRKPGSSRDPISFEKERRFAETVSAPESWSQMGAIWAK